MIDGAVARIERYVHELRIWLRAHCLKCKSDKAEVLMIGSWHQAVKVKVTHVM